MKVTHTLSHIKNGLANLDQERLGSGVIRWCVYEGGLVEEWVCAPTHVLPHRYMHTQLEMMQMACVHEWGHVERQVCPSTHSPSCTHAWLQKNYSYLAQMEGLHCCFMATGIVTLFGVTCLVHETVWGGQDSMWEPWEGVCRRQEKLWAGALVVCQAVESSGWMTDVHWSACMKKREVPAELQAD